MAGEGGGSVSLTGTRAIVTGGARGLGRAMTRALLAAGASVLVADIDPLPAAEIDPATDGLRVARADVTSPDDVDRAVRECVAVFGGVDLVVNNAGVLMREVRRRIGGEGPVRFWDVDAATVRSFLDVHAVGSFLVAKAALPHLRASVAGRIVTVTTSFSTMLEAGRMPYGPAKAAMEAMASVMAADLAGSGVTVNVVIPGRKDGTRLGPEAMGPPLVWLASREAADVTGMRIVAARWDASLDGRAALARAASPLGWATLG